MSAWPQPRRRRADAESQAELEACPVALAQRGLIELRGERVALTALGEQVDVAGGGLGEAA